MSNTFKKMPRYKSANNIRKSRAQLKVDKRQIERARNKAQFYNHLNERDDSVEYPTFIDKRDYYDDISYFNYENWCNQEEDEQSHFNYAEWYYSDLNCPDIDESYLTLTDENILEFHDFETLDFYYCRSGTWGYDGVYREELFCFEFDSWEDDAADIPTHWEYVSEQEFIMDFETWANRKG